MRRFINRQVFSAPWQPGNRHVVNLANANRTLHACYIRVYGKINLTASGSTSKSGGLARMLKLIELSATGYDVATNRRRLNETRMSIPGYLLGYCEQSQAASQLNRINFLNPYSRITAGSAKFTDIVPTTLTEQEFDFILQVPFYVPNGRNPRDFHVDTSQMDIFNLTIECAGMDDLFTVSTPPLASVITDAHVEVYLKEIDETETLLADAGTGAPMGYARHAVEIINVDADNTDFRRNLNFTGNLMQMVFICADDDGVARDGMLENVRLERDNQVYYDLPWQMIRAQNLDTYALHTKSKTDEDIFDDSGVFILTTAGDDMLNREYLGDMQHLESDNSANYILKVKAPSSGKGTITILSSILQGGDAISVVNTPFANLTPAQRPKGQELLNAKNQRAQNIVNAARQSS